MSKAVFIILLFASLLSYSEIRSQSDDDKPIIFILDASGSMWGSINGQPKITVARRVLTDLIQSFPDDQALGLVAYGHRTKGDCNDVEFILNPASNSKKAFLSALEQIKPLGKTPLAISAKLVIDKLRSEHLAAKVILISDGIETCSGDLCALVGEARAEGIDFVLHIIGFDLADSEKQVLECAAEAGGGNYYDAADNVQLAEGLQEAASAVEEEGPVTYTLRCTRDGKLLDAFVQAIEVDSREEIDIGRTYDREDTNPVGLSLPPGQYEIVATPAGEASIFTQRIEMVTLTDDAIHHDTLDWSMGFLSVLCLQNGERVDVAVKVYQSGSGEFVDSKRSYESSNHNPAILNLPPGMYDVVGNFIKAGGVASLHRKGLMIRPNERFTDTLDFSTGQIIVSVTENGKLTDATVNIINPDTRKSLVSGRTYISLNHNPIIKDMSPGRYEVHVKSVKIKGLSIEMVFEDVLVEARQTTKLSHQFPSGILRIKTTFNGAFCNASVSVKSINPVKTIVGGRTYDSEERNQKEFLLSPGTYAITVRPARKYGAQPKSITIELKQGQILEKTVALD